VSGADTVNTTKSSKSDKQNPMDFEFFLNPTEERSELNTPEIQVIPEEKRQASVKPLSAVTLSEISTAHAAVVLAKIQATAAREESKDLIHKLKNTELTLAAEKLEKKEISVELDETRVQYIKIDKELAIEKARLEELRKRADQEYYEKLRLSKKLELLEEKQTQKPKRFSLLAIFQRADTDDLNSNSESPYK